MKRKIISGVSLAIVMTLGLFLVGPASPASAAFKRYQSNHSCHGYNYTVTTDGDTFVDSGGYLRYRVTEVTVSNYGDRPVGGFHAQPSLVSDAGTHWSGPWSGQVGVIWSTTAPSSANARYVYGPRTVVQIYEHGASSSCWLIQPLQP